MKATAANFANYALIYYARKHFAGNREIAAYWINWYCHHSPPSILNNTAIDTNLERFCQSTALAAI